MTFRSDNPAPPSLAQLREMLPLLPEPCALLDATGVVQATNPAWDDMFVQTGKGLPLARAVASLLHWEPTTWTPVAQELDELLAGQLERMQFDAPLSEPPDRWAHCKLATLPGGGLIWQLTDVTRWQIAEAEANRLLDQLFDAIESINDGFALFDEQDRLVYCNQRYRVIYPLTGPVLAPGRTFHEIIKFGISLGQYREAVGDEENYIARRLAIHRQGGIIEQHLSNDTWVRAMDQPTSSGGVVAVRTDITLARQAEALRQQATDQEATIKFQAALVVELSTPLLRIGEGVLVLPLIGSVDTHRAARVVDILLQAVAGQRVHTLILDITGLPMVDSQVADVLIQCAYAVRLLGARTVITGIRPDVAETIIALGIDLSDIVTRANLQQGVAYALSRQR